MRVLLPAFGLGKTGRPYATGGLGFFEVFEPGAVAVADVSERTLTDVDLATILEIERALSTVDLTQDLTVADAVTTTTAALTLTPDVTNPVSMVMAVEQFIASDTPVEAGLQLASSAILETGNVMMSETVNWMVDYGNRNTVGWYGPPDVYWQSFQVPVSGPLTQVELLIEARQSFPPYGNAFVLVADAVGGNVLGMSDLVPELSLPPLGTPAVFAFPFSTPPTLTAGQTYWFAFQGDADCDRIWVWEDVGQPNPGNWVYQYGPDPGDWFEWGDDEFLLFTATVSVSQPGGVVETSSSPTTATDTTTTTTSGSNMTTETDLSGA